MIDWVGRPRTRLERKCIHTYIWVQACTRSHSYTYVCVCGWVRFQWIISQDTVLTHTYTDMARLTRISCVMTRSVLPERVMAHTYICGRTHSPTPTYVKPLTRTSYVSWLILSCLNESRHIYNASRVTYVRVCEWVIHIYTCHIHTRMYEIQAHTRTYICGMTHSPIRTYVTRLISHVSHMWHAFHMCHTCESFNLVCMGCGVATSSRLLKIIGLFCRIWSLL